MPAFQELLPFIGGNNNLREPQVQAYDAIGRHFEGAGADREVGVVLPVGCGKSGLVTLAPFCVRARRALVVAPGLRIASQLLADFNPTNSEMFYQKCHVLDGPDFPEPAEIRGRASNLTDLEEADVVITNIQQLQGVENRWLDQLPSDFFDLILFDEAHHNVASSWDSLRQRFPQAKIVNVSATPTRSDGELMRGSIVYSYPIYRAVEFGFVKRLTGLVLNPESLRYVRREDGKEVTVGLDEVRRLGEEDAGFRRSIVSAEHTLSTIVEASIRELERLRAEAGDSRLKIIASALNMEHCKQVVAAYRARGMRAAFMHSREDQVANQRVLEKLERHELDVIVQVRMLGEGFDHKFLTVAAVFSIFNHLSPFVQFVGRIMRVVRQNDPEAPVNRGVVVFHAGANVTSRWEDFRKFAEADQEFFQLLLDEVAVEGNDASVTDPQAGSNYAGPQLVQITNQSDVLLEELPLLEKAVLAEIRAAQERGVSTDQVINTLRQLQPIPVTKQAKRRASKTELAELIGTYAARIAQDAGLNPEGRELDRQRLGRTNWVVLKAALDKKANALVGRSTGERDKFTQGDLDAVREALPNLAEEVMEEVVNGPS